MPVDVELSQEVLYKMQRAVNHSPSLEVGGLMKVERVEQDGDIWFYVSDICIPPQEVASAHFDVGDDDFTEYMSELNAKTVAENKTSMWNVWRGVWHSHCSMGVSPSGTDTDQLKDLLMNESLSWYLGLVTNVRGEMHAWLIIREPLYLTAACEVRVSPMALSHLDAEVDEQMKLVSRRVYQTKTTMPVSNGPLPYAMQKAKGHQKGLPYDDGWDNQDWGALYRINKDDDAEAAAAAYAEANGVNLDDEEMGTLVELFKRGGRKDGKQLKLCKVSWLTSTNEKLRCCLPNNHDGQKHVYIGKDRMESMEPTKVGVRHEGNPLAGSCQSTFKGNRCTRAAGHEPPDKHFTIGSAAENFKTINWQDNGRRAADMPDTKRKAAKGGK